MLLRAIVVAGSLVTNALLIVLLTRWFRRVRRASAWAVMSLEFMREFVAIYPGDYHLPEWAPVGLPAWLGWQHFFNSFFMLLIIRTGIGVRTEKRPPERSAQSVRGRRPRSRAWDLNASVDVLSKHSATESCRGRLSGGILETADQSLPDNRRRIEARERR